MIEDYHNLTSSDADEEGGSPVRKAPPRLPPSPTWTRRLCPSRRLVLILLGLSVILTLVVIVFGAKGHSFSSQLWGMKASLKSMNQTIAEQVATLQRQETDTDTKITQFDGTVKKLIEESDGARTRLQNQLNDLRRNIRTMNCDLENFKQNKTASPEACCPRGWAAFRKSCYWDSRVGKTWEDAKADCEARDAHLVIINSYEEQQFVAVRVRPQATWIGLTDASGSWKWVDGTTYTVRQEEWCSNQPDNWYGHGLGGGEDCSHLTTRSCWNDDHCTRLYGWICEMEINE
ncbi:asialoglycoprotein receptor 1-like [Elgaria multicarinata webbii]|uniref:asialoglycoprotein receptor 1-like n=1 Tax=Elgaria multicarinata webbii TaxID=159646 RepID=UPI002FCCC519